MENDFDYDAMEESLNQEIKNKNEFVTACPHELLDIIRSLRTAEQERDQYKAELLKSKFEAESLAMAIYRGQYATEAPNFELFNNVTGVISQIDNMYAGLISELESLRAQLKAAQEQEPVAYGIPNSAITGKSQPMMTLHHERCGQYPELMVPLYVNPIIAKAPIEPLAWTWKHKSLQEIRGIYTSEKEAYQAFGKVEGVAIPLYSDPVPAMPIPKQEPAGAVPDEPKNPGAAYLQTFLNDSRFDAAVNSMPDNLIEKFHGRIVERTADRDDWKLYANNLEEDIAKIPSPRITEQDAREIIFKHQEDWVNSDAQEWNVFAHDWPTYQGRALLNKLNKKGGD